MLVAGNIVISAATIRVLDGIRLMCSPAQIGEANDELAGSTAVYRHELRFFLHKLGAPRGRG